MDVYGDSTHLRYNHIYYHYIYIITIIIYTHIVVMPITKALIIVVRLDLLCDEKLLEYQLQYLNKIKYRNPQQHSWAC